MNAQNDEVKVGLRAGHNAVFGGFAAVSLETIQTLGANFTLGGGLQYNTIGKTTLEVLPAYNIPFDWGKLSVEGIGHIHPNQFNKQRYSGSRCGYSLNKRKRKTWLLLSHPLRQGKQDNRAFQCVL